jgi:hypothetical protein
MQKLPSLCYLSFLLSNQVIAFFRYLSFLLFN